jgi:hypothetical protein
MTRGGGGGWNGVQVSVAIAVKYHGPSLKVLDGKTQSIKFNKTIMISYELLDKN